MISFDPKRVRIAMAMGNAATVKVALIIGAYYLGSKLDQTLNTKPWFMLLFIILAMCTGIWYIIHIAKKHKLTE